MSRANPRIGTRSFARKKETIRSCDLPRVYSRSIASLRALRNLNLLRGDRQIYISRPAPASPLPRRGSPSSLFRFYAARGRGCWPCAAFVRPPIGGPRDRVPRHLYVEGVRGDDLNRRCRSDAPDRPALRDDRELELARDREIN